MPDVVDKQDLNILLWIILSDQDEKQSREDIEIESQGF